MLLHFHVRVIYKVVRKGSTLNGKPLIMKWYSPKPAPSRKSPTLPTLAPPTVKPASLPHLHNATAPVNQVSHSVEKQDSIDEVRLSLNYCTTEMYSVQLTTLQHYL